MPAFSNQYVINETLKHMLRSVEISTQKTLKRMPEAVDDEELRKEIFNALINLKRLHNLVQSIHDNNKEILNEESTQG